MRAPHPLQVPSRRASPLTATPTAALTAFKAPQAVSCINHSIITTSSPSATWVRPQMHDGIPRHSVATGPVTQASARLQTLPPWTGSAAQTRTVVLQQHHRTIYTKWIQTARSRRSGEGQWLDPACRGCLPAAAILHQLPWATAIPQQAGMCPASPKDTITLLTMMAMKKMMGLVTLPKPRPLLTGLLLQPKSLP